MHSSYRFLHMTPHSFRQGQLSQEMLEGEDVTSVLVSCRWLLRSNAYEAYARSDLINKEPTAVFNAFSKYRREMSAARVKYLSHNWVHRPGPAETHPHDEILRKFYPDERMTIGPYIPISYPYPSAKEKMRTWIKFRKSGIYVHKQIAEQERIAKEKYCQKKVSQAICRASLQRRYTTNFDKHNFVRIKKLPAEGQPKKCTVETQTTVEAKDQGIQTAYEPLRNLPTILINNSAFPVHNRHILCIANKKDHWQRKASSAKLSVTRTIKWRISPQWRQVKHRCKKQKGLTTSLTRQHHDLIHYFLLEYLVKGERGLPVLVPDDYDKNSVEEDEYMEYILGLYQNKPENYEAEQSFQPRQRAEDRRFCHNFRDNTSDSSSEQDEVPAPAKKPKTQLRRKKKPGVKGTHTGRLSWKKQHTTPVAKTLERTIGAISPEEEVPATRVKEHSPPEAEPTKTVYLDDEPFVIAPVEQLQQPITVVAEFLNGDLPVNGEASVTLTPITVTTAAQETATLYLQPSSLRGLQQGRLAHPPALQQRSASPTSDLPAREHGTATATAVHTEDKTLLPPDPRNRVTPETSEDLIKETELLLAHGEEILGNLHHMRSPRPLPRSSVPGYAQTCPLDLSVPTISSGVLPDQQNN